MEGMLFKKDIYVDFILYICTNVIITMLSF